MNDYNDVFIDENDAKSILKEIYNIDSEVLSLNGEIDFNFKSNAGILKVSRPNPDMDYLIFQDEILKHLESKNPEITFPKTIRINGQGIFPYYDNSGRKRLVRLLEWLPGDLFSSVKSKDKNLLFSLGSELGKITHLLLDFNHTYAERNFDWDIAQIEWTYNYHHLFIEEKRNIIEHFIALYKNQKNTFSQLRKSVIHNDANDNNIIIQRHQYASKVNAIIDYGDAIFSYTINDLAVAIAYGVMGFEDPLEAALNILQGYNESLPLNENECEALYTCVALRLIISVTKSAINIEREPENTYLQISNKPAWELLKKWKNIHPNFANICFRKTCGFVGVKQLSLFRQYASQNNFIIRDILNIDGDTEIEHLDLSIDSTTIGHFENYRNSDQYGTTIETLLSQKKILLVGGYGEARPIYTTDAYKLKTNEGYEHRTIHMGIDFWTSSYTEVKSIDEGEVISIFDNNNNKDYGPTIIIMHKNEEITYYSLYGHLSKSSLYIKKVGDIVKKGEHIGYLGEQSENGNWSPHLHFQIILDMLDCVNDFYGVSSPSNWHFYKEICPDPNLLFKLKILDAVKKTGESILDYRKKHLGRSLSLSYNKPLTIVRGEMQYLIDEQGQKYLDTVNNVAHVGHENTKVIKAAINQIELLNTNTRYLNKKIIEFTELLLTTFPPSLNVVHFVNSGSEANELAMRMAKAYTGQTDMIALEVGYHGNTQGCIDISSYKFNGKGGKGQPQHTHIVPLPDRFRGKYRGENTGKLYAAHVEEIIDDLSKEGRGISGIITESIVSCGGQIELPKDFLKEAFHHVRKAGGLCISDEVQVGFGRVGKKFWGFELSDVIPDIVTLGKPIGNGHPLGAVVCTTEVAEKFANGMEYFNTFGGNPVSCAIGYEVLKYTLDHNLQNHAHHLGEYIKNKFKDLAKRFPYIADVRGQGLFLGVEFCDEYFNPLSKLTSIIVDKMKNAKVLLSIDGPDNNVLKIKPPMVITQQDVDYMMERLEIVLDSL